MSLRLKELTAPQLAILNGGLDNRACANALGIGVGTVSSWRNLTNHPNVKKRNQPRSGEIPTTPVPAPKAKAFGKEVQSDNFTNSGNDWEVSRVVSERVSTYEELIAAVDFDHAVWEVEKWGCRAWEGFIKNKDEKAEIVPTMWSLWAKFSRSKPKEQARQDILEVIELAKTYAPNYVPVIRNYDHKDKGCLLEPSFYDHHFGKHAWGDECGENYDVEIADALLTSAADSILSATAHHDIRQIVMPFGNDFLNIDSSANLTTRGTPQSVDGRYQRTFRVAYESFIRVIDKCLTVAPVHIVAVPGNHDRDSLFALAEVLSAWYRNCKDVTIDNTPPTRKYYPWEKTLLCYTHGNEEKQADLPGIMMREAKHLLAASERQEWHVGHLHAERVKTYQGVKVRVCPSLCSADSWHSLKGYSDLQQTEAFVWSHTGHLKSIEYYDVVTV